MLFSSVPFLYYFLPATLLLYFAAPRRLKNTALLLCSLVFYGWGEPKYLLLMLLSIAQGYGFGLLVEKFRARRQGKLFLTLSVVFSLLMLGYFKYADFFLDAFRSMTGLSVPILSVALPIGISFYTFQILSYVVDVYRGDVRAQRNPIDLALYITMFPQLIAGPIVRYTDVEPQLKVREHTVSGAAEGARRFVLGLAKKILLANLLGELATAVSDDGTVLGAWLYAIAFMLQIYFDFSAYSDMAIGLGRIFGFRFMENFDYPYCSSSITEFWRRWHISLGSWFRDYLYIPLGGSRVGKGRLLLNLLIVWAATGLWHGAAWNFVLWGLFYAALLIAEKTFLLPILKRRPILGHVYTLIFVLLGFILFDAPTLSAAGTRMGALFGAGTAALSGKVSVYYLRSFAVVLVLALLGATPLPERVLARVQESRAGSAVVNVLEPIALTVLLLLCTAYLIDGSFNPFLYFRF